MQVGSTAHAEDSGELREAIEAGRKTITTTVQKFPYILADTGTDHRDHNFAIVIDEVGSIDWTAQDRVQRPITEEIPQKVANDEAYRNAKGNNDPVDARVEHDRALGRVMMAVLVDDTELFKQFSDNGSFRRWQSDAVFRARSDESA